ncbi:uncharacterized mitochondrial protein AtMg00810 [Mangifera indica]|uniref:uncharacterized mitochondrial protein AtMg00810 n=1 Tax=Mangifera indica TaxID=29780 RepID=UPI001CFB3689|nr:uncharacterized mitochondrial protein AtMg00810 [Mangifera indica]
MLIIKGFKNSSADSSLFVFKQGTSVVYVLIYVDDILLTRLDSNFIRRLITDLNDKFALKDMGELDFFLGLDAKRSQKGLLLSQTKYASDLLHRVNMQDCKFVSTPMVIGSKLFPGDSPVFDKPMMNRSVLGALQYLTLTRPDLSYAINKLSQFLNEPTQLQWQAIKRAL